MVRLTLMTAALLSFATTRTTAEEPPASEKKPQYQRMLTGEDAKQVKEWEQQIAALEKAGKRAEASEVAEKVLELRTRVQGADHWKVKNSKVKLADLRRKWTPEQSKKLAEARRLNAEFVSLYGQGRYSEATTLARKALDIRRDVLGMDHPDTAVSLNNLAILYLQQEKYAEAESLQQDALGLNRKVFGNDHPDTATSLNNLALLYFSQRKYVEAEPYYRGALAINRETLGGNSSNTAGTLYNLAELYYSQGRYDEAEPLHKDALRIRRKALGADHPDIASSLINLAGLYKSQGKYALAEPLLQDALRINRKALGEDHPDTARSLNNLAALYVSQGRYVEAEPFFKDILAINREALGDHPYTAYSLNNLAALYYSQGKYASAEPLYQDAQRINRKALGEDHPSTATSLNNLATLYVKQGKYAEAERLHSATLRIRRKALGDDHPETAQSLNNLANLQWFQGQRPAAVAFLREAVPAQEAARFRSASSGFDRSLAAADKFDPRAGLAVALALTGDAEGAFAQADGSFARGLLDDLAGEDAELLEQKRTLGQQLDALQKTLLPLLVKDLTPDQIATRDRLLARRRELSAELGRLAAKTSTDQLVSPAEIRGQIPDDAAVVFWLDELGEHLGCVVRHTGQPSWVELPGTGRGGTWTDDDKALTRRATRSLTNPGDSADTSAAAYAQRVAPLLPYLKGVKRLIVVPTGDMAALPVEALTQDYQVSYTPSPSAFARAMANRRGLMAESLLVMADPNFRRTPIELPAPPPYGLLVKGVLPKSLASRIGLKPGDILLEYAGTKLNEPADIAYAKEGEQAAVKLWKDGQVLAGRIPGGDLGIAVDERPVAVALKAWRDGDTIALALSRGGKDWNPLPGTRLEARLLQGLFPESRLYLGSDASQQTLMKLAESGELKQFRMLHFATHGEAVPEMPRRSALILAQDKLPTPKEQEERVLRGEQPVEGRLDVETVLRDWELDADLVVLSACQTGLGKQTAGAGMLGFTQALLQRGARSVVLSRWEVDDAATALLMQRFYENLLNKKLGRAAALREAKEWLRKLSRAEATKLLADLVDGVPRGERGTVKKAAGIVDGEPSSFGEKGDKPFEAPYYWAAFILVGDPD